MSPLTMGRVCLPGGELPGCKYVGQFRNNDLCSYYVIQEGDIVSKVADSLRIYLPDINNVNKDLLVSNLKAGDLIKLPPWDPALCGSDLPRTEPELGSLPPAPPPPNRNSSTPPPLVGLNDGGVVICDAYRATASDTIFTVATTFSIPVRNLMDFNPDLAGGAPLVEGTIVKLTDQSNCDQYDLKDGLAAIEASIAMVPPPPPPIPPGPVQVGVISEDNPMTYNEPINSTDVADYEQYTDTDAEGLYNGRPIMNNIVTDAPAATDTTEPHSGPGIGIYIMIAFLALVFIIVLSMMSIAISNSIKRHGLQETSQHDTEQGSGKNKSSDHDDSPRKGEPV